MNKKLLRLAKLNDVTNEIKGQEISAEIRKEYKQADVESLIINALEDIVSQLVENGQVTITTEHLQEFKEYCDYRHSVKEAVKQEL